MLFALAFSSSASVAVLPFGSSSLAEVQTSLSPFCCQQLMLCVTAPVPSNAVLTAWPLGLRSFNVHVGRVTLKAAENVTESQNY